MPLVDLDTAQKSAATSQGSQVVVSAGAGSGKTRLLVGRYLYLLKDGAVPMREVAAITFTEKAAAQMKAAVARRARDLAGDPSRNTDLWKDIAANVHEAPISTIHSFCNALIRRFPGEAGIDPLFGIVDDTTGIELLNEALNGHLAVRMETEPELMGRLIGIFGMTGLRRALLAMLGKRSALTRFLDDPSARSPEELEAHHIAYLTTRIRYYRTMIGEFHSLGPGMDDEKLYLKIDGLVSVLDNLDRMIVEDSVEADLLESATGALQPGGAGSKIKWGECGFTVSGVRDGMRECLAFLSTVASFYRHDRGMAADVSKLLLDEYCLLERRFLDLKKERSCLDHDDSLIETWRLLRNNVSVRQEAARSFRHILVDEFQDTDGIQMDILRMITGNAPSTLFTVGDPKQSIYRFRGADVTVFNEFMTEKSVDFKSLRSNYRSSPLLVRFVNHTFGAIMGGGEISEHFEAEYSEMRAERRDIPFQPGVEVAVFEDRGGEDHRRYGEAAYIADRIARMHVEHGIDYKRMAILFRKGTQTRPYEETLLSRGIAYVNLTGDDPNEMPEIRDCANLLGWLCEPNDPLLFTALLMSPFFSVAPEVLLAIRRLAGDPESMPRTVLFDDRRIGHEWLENSGIRRIRETLLRLLRLRDRVTIRALIEEAFDLTGYTLTMLADPVEGELSLSVLDWFLQTADAFELNGGTLREFARLLERRSLPRDMASTVETRDDAVTIMTVHKSKGLEFKVVFLADIASPVRKSREVVAIDPDMGVGFRYRSAAGGTVETLAARVAADTEARKDIAESKRLFYVGCTRAEDLLVITGGKPSNTADPLFEKDNWMGWLHAALDIAPDGSPGADTPADLVSYSRVDLSERTFDVAPAETLRRSFGEARAEARGDSIELPPPPAVLSTAGKPAHLSPTRILDYLDCPARYRFVHEYGLKGGGTAHGAAGGRGEQYGSYAHRVMERLGAALEVHRRHGKPAGEESPDPPPENAAPAACVVRYLSEAAESFMKPAYPRNWKAGIERELARFAGTPLFKAIASAERIMTEEPFGFTHDGVLVRGVVDLVYGSGEETVVVDYKTDAVEGDAVNDAVGRYSIQLGIYGHAVERAEYTLPAKLVIYFLKPGVEYVVPCTRAFLDDTLGRISRVIGGISHREFPPKRSPRCDSCPFSRLCGPE